MSLSGVVQAEYEYNAFGQQVIRRLTQAGQTIHSVHDADGNRIAEYDYDEVAQSSTLLREYVWMNGEAVAVIEGGVIYYIRTDHIGRPVFATIGTGTKVWTASYLPFGGVHTSTSSNIDLRFPGQWFQSESGLHQNWMRDYDPTTGRYIQADPLGLVDGASIYGYVRQNPGRYVDPRGEEWSYYSLPDGNTGMAWRSGGSTYSPSGESAWRNPTENVHPDSAYAQCKRECENKFDLENFSNHGAGCAATGYVAGLITRGGPVASYPVSSMCIDAVCTDKCRKQCGFE